MEDNLVFGVKIDLQKGVEEALKDGDKALERIEKLFGKHPIAIKLQMDNRVARGASAELTGFKKQLAELTQQWNSLTAAERGSAAGAAIREKFRALRTEAQGYTSTLQAAVKAEDKMRESHSKTAASANKLSSAYHNQSTYLSRLIQRMAAYAGVSYVGNFLTNVREVTAQFELQRISLGAIIQDQQRANQLFEEIKTFALKSPVKILDLTKYTKQLAAYKIGVDELFDTTKRLTDISVGLGVSMDRIVLMYGQIRATGYLRASEVRQATEAGIPLVEELAKKLSKANDELVTAADVMDMISKRAISFDMVKEVFDDMTSAGGIFYNMQEKQGNTLYGMWAKLGDAASVMYSEIGNTGPINDGMKSLISGLTSLMKNWRLVAGEAMVAVASFGAYKAIQALAVVSTEASTKATQRLMAAKNGLTAAQNRLAAAKRLGNKAAIQSANSAVLEAQWTVKAAAANRLAANTTNVWTAAKYRLIAATSQLKAAVAGNWIMLTVAAVAAIGVAIVGAIEKATRLNRELDKIKEETGGLQTQSVRNFEYLAEAAVKAADGSKQQKDALDELQRTYGDILPAEALTIKNLRAMRGNYEALTRAIRENIAAQQESKALEEIKNEYSPKIIKAQKDAEKALSKSGFGDVEIQRFFRNIEKHYRELSDRLRSGENIDIMGELLNMSGIDKSKLSNRRLMDVAIAYTKIVTAQEAWIQKENDIRSSYEESTVYLGAYTRSMQNYNSWVQKNMNSGETMLQNQQNVNMQIRGMESMIRQGMQNAGLAWKEEWANMITSIDPNDLGKTSTLNINAILAAIDPNKYPELYRYVQEYQKIYEGLIPSDPTVQQIRAKLFAVSKSTGANIDTMRQFLWDGSTSVDDYLKTLNDQIDRYEAELVRLQNTLANPGMLGSVARLLLKGKIEETTKIVTALKEQAAFVKPYVPTENNKKKGGSKGTKSDPRLQTLQEIANKMAEVNKEYDELLKKEGQTKALADTQKLFASSFKQMEATAKKYGFKLPAFEVPQTIEDVQKWYKAIMDNIKRLKLKNADKVLIELGFKSDKAAIDKQQKDIEAELKRLSDRISRTKTAKEFYEKILEQTGDINIATRVSMSIYGSTGEELFNDTVEQIREAFKTGSEEHPIDLDISAAIDLENQRIDYKKLADIYDKYQDEIIEKRRDTAKKIATEGQKEVATDILNWRKSLAKAKSYEQKRTDIINTATAERAKIIRETTDPKERGELLGLSYSKQAQELAKLAVDEFKSSDDYIKVFQDLDRVSTQTLDRMKKRLEEMIATVKDTENVEGLKTLVEQLDKIKEERETRNPIEGIIDSFKEYAKARKDYRTAEAEEAAAKAEFAQQEVGLNMAIQTAKDEQATAQQRVNDLKAQGKENTSEGVAAELVLNEATKKVTQATENRNKAVKKVNNAEQKTTDALDAQKAALAKLQKNVNAMANAFNSAASSIKTIADMMGIAEDSELGDIVNGLVDGLNNAATIMTTILAIAIAIEAACWWMLAIGAAVAAFSAIGSWLTGSKVRKANKEIERQQELLDQLEYTYGRLEQAADKVFGRDYVNNYNQQLKNLQAQQTAYLKQAEAERSKGKKKDKDKIKEYENQARETADKIKELQDDLVAHFTGSSRTDVARQMAKSWIDARASMSDTFAAIKGDYADMIKNMIVEGAAARVIENALTPVWDSMEKMLAKNDVQGAIDSLVNGMDSALNAANNGMEVLWKALEARGYDMKNLIGDTDSEYTGIAKSVAGATSEEILQLSGFVNTALYHTAYLPKIYEELVAMRTASLPTATVSATSAGWTDWQQQAMDNYQAIARNTAETVVRCERAAIACEKMARVIKTKGATSGFNVFLNS